MPCLGPASSGHLDEEMDEAGARKAGDEGEGCGVGVGGRGLVGTPWLGSGFVLGGGVGAGVGGSGLIGVLGGGVGGSGLGGGGFQGGVQG